MARTTRRRVSAPTRARHRTPRPAPGDLEILRSFLNTAEHQVVRDLRPDRLQSRREVERWLQKWRLLAAGTELTRADVERLRQLRAVLASLVTGGPEAETQALSSLQEVVGEPRFELDVRAPGAPQMKALGAGLDRAVAILAWIFAEAKRDGRWKRLKVCGECGRVFYDRARNRTSKWCTTLCGERVRARKHQRRKKRKEAQRAREQRLAQG